MQSSYTDGMWWWWIVHLMSDAPSTVIRGWPPCSYWDPGHATQIAQSVVLLLRSGEQIDTMDSWLGWLINRWMTDWWLMIWIPETIILWSLTIQTQSIIDQSFTIFKELGHTIYASLTTIGWISIIEGGTTLPGDLLAHQITATRMFLAQSIHDVALAVRQRKIQGWSNIKAWNRGGTIPQFETLRLRGGSLVESTYESSIFHMLQNHITWSWLDPGNHMKPDLYWYVNPLLVCKYPVNPLATI